MTYDWNKPTESLETIKSDILDFVKNEEKWYSVARGTHSFFSRSIRVIATLLFTFGIVWPILSIKATWLEDTNMGYLSLAIGGIFLLLDKYLGVSVGEFV